MSTPTNPSRRKKPSTDIWQNHLSEEELQQLQVQDHLVTEVMGGVLPEQPDPASFRHVLDVGCGTGDWLIEVAQAYPSIPELVGIDADPRLVAFAEIQAEAQQVSTQVQFRTMDALGFLDFTKASFDVINLRFGSSFLRTWEWLPLLEAFKRIAQPGGIIRLTEFTMVESSNPLVRQREELIQQALFQSGHFFTPQTDGATNALVSLLRQQGYQNVQTYIHTLHYHDGDAQQHLLAKYLGHGLQALQPFLQKWTRLPEGQEELSQQLRREMQAPDFKASVRIQTAWGNNPLEKNALFL